MRTASDTLPVRKPDRPVDGFPSIYHRTKIIASLGPSTEEPETIYNLASTGVDTFRINMSHGTREQHASFIEHVRATERMTYRPLGIIVDLQGRKLRIGEVKKSGRQVKPGAKVTLTYGEDASDGSNLWIPHAEMFVVADVGTNLVLGDNEIRLAVVEKTGSTLTAIALNGGTLRANQGISIPGTPVPLEPLTRKGEEDLEFAIKAGADWAALSYVQTPAEVLGMRTRCDGRIGVLAKIETSLAIENLAEIIELSDAIMVARGDLGVEMGVHAIPPLQRRIIRENRQQGKPVVVATQMLESMPESPTPIRAEAFDIYNALFDGADALMLSGETSADKHPVRVVEFMRAMIDSTEATDDYAKSQMTRHQGPGATTDRTVAYAAAQLANHPHVTALISHSTSGEQALHLSHVRSMTPLIGLSTDIRTVRKLAIAWGVHNILFDPGKDEQPPNEKAIEIALDMKLAARADTIVLVLWRSEGEDAGEHDIRLLRVRFDPKEQSLLD